MRTSHFGPMGHRYPAPALLTALIAGISGCGPTEGLPGEAQSIADDAITIVEEIRSFNFTLDDELGIGTVVDLVAMPDGYALSDGAGFVHLLNDDLSLRAHFGGEGGGPTELDSPLDLEVAGAGIAVYDSGNNRILVIDADGELVRNVPPRATQAGNFGWLPDGSIVVRRGGGFSGLAYYHPSANGPFGADSSPVGGGPTPEVGMPDLSDGHLTASPSGRVHYYDTTSDLLYTYGPAGTPEATLRWPDGVRDRIAVDRRAAEEAFAGRFVGFSHVMSLTTWGEYPVIVAPGLPGIEALALVVEPDRRVATRIVAGPSLDGRSIPSPDALALKGDVLTIAATSGLYQYEVRYPAHLRRNETGTTGRVDKRPDSSPP